MNTPGMDVEQTIRELVTANHILAREGVVDALGHVSARHPEDAGHYLLSCSRSPALVREEDIMEFDSDNVPIDPRGRALYSERALHGAIYRLRPDVHAICHSHAHPLIPFGLTGIPLVPVWVAAAAMGGEAPVWDIREDFPDEGTMLVARDEAASSLARRLGSGRVCLMAGPGGIAAAETIKAAVQVAISLVANAELLAQSLALAPQECGGKIRVLSVSEISAMSQLTLSPGPLERMWDYWTARAGAPPGTDAGNPPHP